MNSHLRSPLDHERRVALDREIAGFLDDARGAQDERCAFELAAIASWTRGNRSPRTGGKNEWPPMNADENKMLSAFFCVHRRP